MKKLKILYFVDNFYPVVGGINSVIDGIGNGLKDYIDLTVCAVHCKRYKDPPRDYKVIRCPGYYNSITHDGMAHPTKKFIKQIEDENYDLFHCHTVGNLFDLAIKIGHKQKIPVITTIHNTYYQEVKSYVKSALLAKLITKIFFKRTQRADYVWSVSKFALNNAKKYGFKKTCKILYNASTFASNNNTTIDEDFKNKYNLSPNTFVMTFVSRMIKVKNIDLVIEGIKMLKDKHKSITDIKVFCVGGGNYLDVAMKRVRNLGLENYFIFTGMITDKKEMQNYYKIADLVLFPSTMESTGLIHIEASSFYKPTLVIKDYAPAENIRPMYNGLICKNNPESFLNQVIYAYLNREKLKIIGKNANATLCRTYNDKEVINEIISNYYSVIHNYKNKKNSTN